MIEAAIAAGADTAYLSGSGPTVAAITSGAAGDIFLQRTKERVDKQVNFGHSKGSIVPGGGANPLHVSINLTISEVNHQ